MSLADSARNGRKKPNPSASPKSIRENIEFSVGLCIGTYRPITNERESLLMKSSKKYFIFASACCLIIWLMISPKNFEKKAF